jgi:Opacity family porin protein
MKSIKILALICSAIALAMTNGANAQEPPSANVKQNSIGPAIEFGGGGTSYGIKGKIGVGQQFSIRPMILFGYKPSVSGSDILKGTVTNKQGTNPINPTGATPTSDQQAALNSFVSDSLGSGIGYGLALTYDFKSSDGKIQGYIGPSILFGSASNSGNATGLSAVGVPNGLSATTSTSETNIGLTAGTDFAISENFTAGVNATYNFSRSGNYNFSANIPGAGDASLNAPLSGSSFKFGVNFGYSF